MSQKNSQKVEASIVKSKLRLWHELLGDTSENGGNGIHLVPRATKIYRFLQYSLLSIILIVGLALIVGSVFFGYKIANEVIYLYGTILGAVGVGAGVYENTYRLQKKDHLQNGYGPTSRPEDKPANIEPDIDQRG